MRDYGLESSASHRVRGWAITDANLPESVFNLGQKIATHYGIASSNFVLKLSVEFLDEISLAVG